MDTKAYEIIRERFAIQFSEYDVNVQLREDTFMWTVELLRDYIKASRFTSDDGKQHYHVVPTDMLGYKIYPNKRIRLAAPTKLSPTEWLDGRPASKAELQSIEEEYIVARPNDLQQSPRYYEPNVFKYYVPSTRWDAFKLALRSLFPGFTAPFWSVSYRWSTQKR